MKKTIIFASVALATLFAFSSCQKETLQDNESTNGVRIITAEFENKATKTELNDGVTPEWAIGDVIRILNATSHQDVTLISGEDTPINPGDGIIKKGAIVFAIPVTMTGTLYAVYPASATTMKSCTDGNINFTIPAVQDGSFSSANICVAKSIEDDETNKDNLIFRNATAVLKITTSSAVVGVDVTATNFIAGEVTATFSGTAISLTTTSLDRHYVSAVGTSAPTGNVFYLATAPVTTGAAKVNCYTTEKKGTVEKESKDLSKNIIYNMDLTSVVPAMSDLTGQRGILNGHEYVLIKAKYDSSTDSYLKWATMNIGATALTGTDSYGDYFMWGAVEKAYASLSGSTFNFGVKPSSYVNSTWDATKCFAWDNGNFTDGVFNNSSKKNVFTKYTYTSAFAKSGTADGKTVLEAEDDAATHNWGSTWRMPTGGSAGEFKALKDATKWTWDATDKGYYLTKLGEDLSATKSNALLFFPDAGRGDGLTTNAGSSNGRYWSSTLNTNTNEQHTAHQLKFDSDSVNPEEKYSRYAGLSVRPVSN